MRAGHGASPLCFRPPYGRPFYLQGWYMGHAIRLIREFEQLAIQLCLTVCTVSGLARWVWIELKAWRNPNTKHTSKKTR
jgi:hypothetical protein